MLDVAAERQRLLEQIKQHADPRHQAGMMTVTRTKLKVYGVKVPNLRAIARAWQRTHEEISREELLTLVETLWAGKSQEEHALALELLLRYHRWIPDLTWAHFDRWRYGLDNWGLTDKLGVYILGRWVLSDPQRRVDHLWDLIGDKHVWSRRLALVATVWLNRNDGRFADITLELIELVKEEHHPMITKAVSWALREMIKRHPFRVDVYVQENLEILAAHVVREVNNKLYTGLKSGKS